MRTPTAKPVLACSTSTTPRLDLAGVATSLGVPSERATTAEELVSALRRSYATPGPTFIEAVLPKRFG